jgi:hypothetical protein
MQRYDSICEEIETEDQNENQELRDGKDRSAVIKTK